jgi:cytidylate kinase
VIVGRCADFVLSAAGKEDLVKLFVYADLPSCMRRTMEVDGILDNKQAMDRMARITRQRREYHKYYTGKEWEDMDNYDLLINTSKLEYEQVVDIICGYIRKRGYEI